MRADEWKPVLKVMNDGAEQSIGHTRVEDMNAAFVESTYSVARARASILGFSKEVTVKEIGVGRLQPGARKSERRIASQTDPGSM